MGFGTFLLLPLAATSRTVGDLPGRQFMSVAASTARPEGPRTSSYHSIPGRLLSESHLPCPVMIIWTDEAGVSHGASSCTILQTAAKQQPEALPHHSPLSTRMLCETTRSVRQGLGRNTSSYDLVMCGRLVLFTRTSSRYCSTAASRAVMCSDSRSCG